MRKQFIYVTGSSGSGSNIIARVLSRTPGVLGVGETHLNFDHFLVEKFNEANRLSWDRHTDFKDHDYHFSRLLSLIDDIEKLEQNKDVTHIVFKRSILNGDRYRADLCDVMREYPSTKVVVMFRKPEAAAYSAHRRKLGKNLRHCAILQEEQLTILSHQLRSMPDEQCMVINYEEFCHLPMKFREALSIFCGLDEKELGLAIMKEELDEKKIDRWRDKLGEELSNRLSTYFMERQGQWEEIMKKALNSSRVQS